MDKKILYYSPERKTFETKNNNHELPGNVCFWACLVKCKENNLDKKYWLLFSPAKDASSPTISQREQNL